MKTTASSTEPSADCALCPRLHDHRQALRQRDPDWHNAPVPTFGPPDARLLIVGLAPGERGANRTGRPFTGDHAGDLLYAMLARHGLSSGTYAADPADGLVLVDTRLTNAVRCLPPQNKPTGPEIRTCNPYLAAEIGRERPPLAILALGRIAHDAVLRALGLKLSACRFAHDARHELAGPGGRHLVLHDSYHCSRYNTNTGRLTEAMFDAVFRRIAATLASA